MDEGTKTAIDRAHAVAIFHTLCWAQEQIEKFGLAGGLKEIKKERERYYKKRWGFAAPPDGEDR